MTETTKLTAKHLKPGMLVRQYKSVEFKEVASVRYMTEYGQVWEVTYTDGDTDNGGSALKWEVKSCD